MADGGHGCVEEEGRVRIGDVMFAGDEEVKWVVGRRERGC